MMDYQHIEELEHLYNQLFTIQKCLSEAMEEEVLAKVEFLRACATIEKSEKLSEQAKMIALCARGKEKIATRLLEAEKEVAKAKSAFKVAEHAVNIKKHLGNIQPKG
jgi:hypothetical protein